MYNELIDIARDVKKYQFYSIMTMRSELFGMKRSPSGAFRLLMLWLLLQKTLAFVVYWGTVKSRLKIKNPQLY